MAKKVYEENNISNIATAIRDKTGGDKTYKTSEMASGVNEVFDAGKQAEYDKFWDAFQEYGADDTDYNYKFYYWRNGDGYNPKYTIKTNKGTCNSTFYGAFGITDTKVDIDVSEGVTKINNMFTWAKNLKTIKKLKVSEKIIIYADTFTQCEKLENIVIEGMIGADFRIQYSPLTVDSMKSIINALKNYSGTTNELAYTVSFSSGCWETLEASGTAPNGDTWRNYVTYKLGWNV